MGLQIGLHTFSPLYAFLLWIITGFSLHAGVIIAGQVSFNTKLVGAIGFSFIEICFISSIFLMIALCRKKNQILSDFLFFLVFTIFFFLYAAQTYAAWISGSYLTVLALENSGETRFLASADMFVIAVIWGGFLASGYAIQKNLPLSSVSGRPKRYVVLFFAITSLVYSAVFSKSAYPAGDISINWDHAPMASLSKSYLALLAQRDKVLSEISAMGAAYQLEEYPFQKDWVYKSDLPFQSEQLPNQPNVIVIFSEGVSARLLGAYGGPEDLMPNLNRLSQKSMVVDGYYNHTAATFRGLQGQLTSGYPFIGGSMEGGWAVGKNSKFLRLRKYSSLVNILNKEGYDTLFFSPHSNSNPLNDMLRSLGFDKVISQSDLESILGRNSDREAMMDDEGLFSSLIKHLDAQHSGSSPFFIATYNIGTHAFFDVTDQSKAYKDGQNQVLNRMHEFDRALGNFIDYFLTSEHAKNTILIVTADHATYPEAGYVEFNLGKAYKPYFVDSIPLIIHSQQFHFPERLEVGPRTSIDFAPTLLHMLSIKQAENSFLGRSLFESNPSSPYSYAVLGHEFYLMTENEVIRGADVDRDIFGVGIDRFVDSVYRYYALEEVGRIFKD